MDSSERLVDGLVFPECLRWHQGHLWISDMYGYRVVRTDLSGNIGVVGEFHDVPAGIGFLPDGTPLVVLRYTRRIVRLDDGRVSVHADLNVRPSHSLNDMVVDDTGRAYVGYITVGDRGASNSDAIFVVEADGSFREASGGHAAPNGLVITPDHKALIYAATFRNALIITAIDQTGMLGPPTVFAGTGRATPDGICLDEEGAVWAAGLEAGCFLRIRPGGEVAQTISVGSYWALSCVLGGLDGRTLFMACAEATRPVGPETSRGFIETASVDVPHAGWP